MNNTFIKLKYNLVYRYQDVDGYEQLMNIFENYKDVALFAFFNLCLDMVWERDRRRSFHTIVEDQFDFLIRMVEFRPIDICDELDYNCFRLQAKTRKISDKELLDHFFVGLRSLMKFLYEL